MKTNYLFRSSFLEYQTLSITVSQRGKTIYLIVAILIRLFTETPQTGGPQSRAPVS